MNKFKFLFLSLALIFVLSGCNIQNRASEVYNYDRTSDVSRELSDFGGNVAYAASPADSIAVAPTVLAEYSTKFANKKYNRIHNVKKASVAIDEKIIAPGEVFSFNDAVGPTKKETGFLLARIFVEGKDSEGYGGGVCQVSSTLYNAAVLAGLDVVERHSHSKPVTYVPEGCDAATSYGWKDLKFSNNLPYAVMINSYVTKNGITVAIQTL